MNTEDEFCANPELEDKNNVHNGEVHVLYSNGRMFKTAEDENYFEYLKEIAVLTRRSSQEVEEIILTGQRKKIKSSSTLKLLVQLEAKLKELSLDVFIEQEKPEKKKKNKQKH